MKKIIFICPYFGKLPELQTKIWIKTCKYNPEIDWLILTDDMMKFEVPNNIKIRYTTLENLKRKFEKKLQMHIKLENGYKLCDFKPLYGYLFFDEIKEYEYWGHCDMSDSIFGDIQKFLFEIIKDKPDKIGFFGHMTLYKNTDEVNKRFFLKTKSGVDLDKIIGSNRNMAFDEINDYSINTIYKENNFGIKRMDDIYFDITPNYKTFRCSIRDENFNFVKFMKEKYIFEWDKGKLYKICLDKNKSKIVRDEIGYIHYQKRVMKCKIDIGMSDKFYIVPNEFVNIDSLDIKTIKKYTRNQLINTTYLSLKYKRFKYKLKMLWKNN